MKRTLERLLTRERIWFFTMPALLWQTIFYYIPIGGMIVLSFTHPAVSAWFTLENYRHFFTNTYVLIIGRSLLLALVNASLCLIAAYPVTYYIALKVRPALRNIFLFFLIVPFWTSLLVQVYAWFFVLERYGLINSLLLKLGLISQPLALLNNTFAIYLVMLYCYLPFMIMPLYSTLEKLDRRLLEAAADLGAAARHTFFKVTLPLTMPGIRTGFFLVFVPSFGELVVPTLLGGGKQLFVGTVISQYFLGAQDMHLGAAFTTISGVALAICALTIQWFFVRSLKWYR